MSTLAEQRASEAERIADIINARIEDESADEAVLIMAMASAMARRALASIPTLEMAATAHRLSGVVLAGAFAVATIQKFGK